jgi:hypothetical protein
MKALRSHWQVLVSILALIMLVPAVTLVGRRDEPQTFPRPLAVRRLPRAPVWLAELSEVREAARELIEKDDDARARLRASHTRRRPQKGHEGNPDPPDIRDEMAKWEKWKRDKQELKAKIVETLREVRQRYGDDPQLGTECDDLLQEMMMMDRALLLPKTTQRS